MPCVPTDRGVIDAFDVLLSHEACGDFTQDYVTAQVGSLRFVTLLVLGLTLARRLGSIQLLVIASSVVVVVINALLKMLLKGACATSLRV